MRGPGAAIMVSAASSDQQTTEINSELEVQVPLLLEDPLKALEPLLQKVQGWEEVNSAKRVCMHVHASPAPLDMGR